MLRADGNIQVIINSVIYIHDILFCWPEENEKDKLALWNISVMTGMEKTDGVTYL